MGRLSARYDRRSDIGPSSSGRAVAFDESDGTVIVVGDMDIYRISKTESVDHFAAAGGGRKEKVVFSSRPAMRIPADAFLRM